MNSRPNPIPPAVVGQTTRRYAPFASRQSLAVTTAGVVSANVEASEVMLCAAGDLVFEFGSSPSAALATGIPLAAGEKFHFQIEPGTKIAARAVQDPTTLLIVPVAA